MDIRSREINTADRDISNDLNNKIADVKKTRSPYSNNKSEITKINMARMVW